MYQKLTVALVAFSLSLASLVASESHSGSDDAQAAAQQSELKTPLHGPAITGEKPNGTADFRTDGTRTRLTVEVEDVNLPDGTVFSVVVIHNGAGTVAGKLRLAAGFGELELRSQDGDVVPPVQEGDVVIVKEGSTRRLAGVF